MTDNKDFTILVIEDERPLLEAIHTKLENNGLKVATARSVEQALGYLKDLSKVDAIWLDHYLLGKESGLDFVATLKKDGGEWKNIPVFVVSNTASEDKVQAYLRFGITKYYAKTAYRLDQIIAEIKSYLIQGRSE
jgi:CheY-like chemotaxis protein